MYFLSFKIPDTRQLNMLSILAFCQVCDGGADKMEMKVRAPATTKKVAVSSFQHMLTQITSYLPPRKMG